MDYPLNVSSETVYELIARARRIHTKEAVVIPTGDEGDEDWGAQLLADHASDPIFEEFRLAIEDLEPDQQVDLVALMWVGRDDFSAEDWDTAHAEAADRWTPRTAEYLLGTPLVADYLSEGLNAFGYSEE